MASSTDIEIREPDFTGEFFVPGKSGERIEADHYERYVFAAKYAKGKSVLDIACGAGYSSPLFMEAGAKDYVGVDINEQLTNYANIKYGRERVKYVKSDICSFDLGVKYGMITCFETIEHVPDYIGALKNLYGLLDDNGLLLISSPNRPITSPGARNLTDKPGNEFHTQEFTPDELTTELLRAGFSVDLREIYGQRQRVVFPGKLLNELAVRLFGDPDSVASPNVSKVRRKVPRYFILVASKSVI